MVPHMVFIDPRPFRRSGRTVWLFEGADSRGFTMFFLVRFSVCGKNKVHDGFVLVTVVHTVEIFVSNCIG